MIKLLIVDDNKNRSALIEKELTKHGFAERVTVVMCDSADGARLELVSLFDLMILDVLLPKKSDGVPQAEHSFKLLEDVYNPEKKYLKPNLIIGLTAEVQDIGTHKEKFENKFTTVLAAPRSSTDWLKQIVYSVEGVLGHEQKVISCTTDKVLITVHGIRTYGKWQRELSESIRKYSRDFDSIEMKYGFFDLVSFAVPYLRDRKAKKIAARIARVLETNADKSIYIVAHSYGTYILSRALMSNQFLGKIKKIILCGSPLSHGHDIDHIINSSELTVNECGVSDFIVMLARAAVLGMGDAGRVGFTRENGKNFINRFFTGGHSLYFKETSEPTFYERFWVPLLTTDSDPVYHDERSNYFGEDFLDLTVKILGLLKPIIYIVVVLLCVRYFAF